MATIVKVLKPAEAWTAQASKPLDEAAWQAWITRGRARDRQDHLRHARIVKCVAAAGMLASVLFWTQLAPYEIATRFIVSTAATFVLFEAFHRKEYSIAAVFAALALVYNPVASLVTFTGEWQRGLVFASTIPFVASLALGNSTRKRHV